MNAHRPRCRWRLVASAAGAIGLRAAPAAAACDDPFARPDQIIDLHVRMPRAEWAAMRASPAMGVGCDGQYPYFKADFRCGADEPWITIGVRKKRGEQRGIDSPDKPPLKLDFNRHAAAQSWPRRPDGLGHRRLSLNNGQSDNPGGILPSLLSEQVSWRLMRRELPFAPGVAYARLFVHPAEDENNPDYRGMYILLEDIDRAGLRARFGDARGKLVKTTGGALDRSVPVCRDEIVFDDGGTNQAAAAYAAWIARAPASVDAATWERDTESVLDLEGLLTQEAIRDILGNNNDSVTGTTKNNHYAFDPTLGRRVYFPWDLDDCFGRADGMFTTSLPVTLPIVPGCSDVGLRTRCHAGIKGRYLRRMCQLVSGTMSLDGILAEIDRVDQLVRPLLAAEAKLFGGRDPLSPMIPGSHVSELAKIKNWITLRIPEVRRQLQVAGITCADGCTDGAGEACGYLSCAGTRRCQNNRWTACTKNPARELCGNGKDDTCDGLIDEGCADAGADAAASTDGGAGAVSADARMADAPTARSATDGAARPAPPASPTTSDGATAGCGCALGVVRPRAEPVALAALVLAAWSRLRRRRR